MIPWKILLVDDDEDDFILTRDLLYQVRKGKFTLDLALTYQAGLQAILDHEYDAVLCDYDLGAQTGIDLIKEVIRLGRQTPIILLTGRGGYDVDVEAMQAGAVDYLDKKVVTPILLERSIRYAIDRQKAENELRQANQDLARERTRLRAVIDNAPTAIVFTDRAGEFVITNSATRDVFGGDITGDASGPSGGYTLNHSDGTPFAADDLPLPKALNEGQASSGIEMIVQRDDGTQVFILANTSPIHDADGCVTGAVAVMQDVSQLKRAEQALRKRESQFYQMANSMPQLVWTADPDGMVDFYNQRWKEYEGISPLEDGSWQWQLVVHPNDLEHTSQAWLAAVASGNVYQAEHRIHLAKGGFRWHLSRGIPVKDEDGRVIKWYGTATDIHEQKQVELELRQNQAEILRTRNALLETQERFRLALSTAPVFVFHTDRDLRYTWAYNSFLNRSPQELIGHSDEELFGESCAALVQAKHEVAATGRKQRLEITFELEDGPMVYDLSIEPLFDSSAELIGITGAAMDITGLRQLEAREVEQRAQIEVHHRLMQQREMERLQIAREIHDGPIQDLISAAMFLTEMRNSESPAAREEQERQVDATLHKCIGDLRQFCHDLRPPTLAPFGLEKAIRSHLAGVLERHPKYHFELDLMKDGQTLPEETRMALFRVYQELINNILKHAQATRIGVRLIVGIHMIVLEVSDDGAGFTVPSDWLALARDGHLGLIGIRERVDAINGELQIVSRPGQGSTITVTVQLDRPVS